MTDVVVVLLLAVVLAVAVVLALRVLLWFTATLGPHCRCGHHRSVHRGSNTECAGLRRAGKNAIGARQSTWCTCQSYRRTSADYWRRILHGTEEHQ